MFTAILGAVGSIFGTNAENEQYYSNIIQDDKENFLKSQQFNEILNLLIALLPIIILIVFVIIVVRKNK